MKTILNIACAVALLCGCATVPTLTKSSYLVTENVGETIQLHGHTANAFIDLFAQAAAPDLMYLEAVLPDPSRPGVQEVIRKEFKKADGKLHIDGSEVSGWESGTTYTYVVRVYADSAYKTLLGTHVQRSLYFEPPGLSR